MRNITKSFDAVLALNDASLKVKQGEIMALLGSNGSGKSTMVKVLSGLVNPTHGEVLIDGKPVSIKSAADARNLSIAVAYQDLSLIPAMSVIDNIVLALEPKMSIGMINRKKARETAEFYLNKLKIDVDPDALVQYLMPSTQSMVEIAKALALQPKLLILDEATASLHSDEVDILFDLLQEIKKEGVSVIIVTHRMNEIFRVCDRCTILKAGQTVAAGSISEMDLDEIVFHMTGKRPDKNTGVCECSIHQNKEEDLLLDVRGLTMLPKLDHVDFKAYKGEVVGIGGLDGQGQSEFIRAILADTKYTGGEIIYRGKTIKYKSTADAIADDMGFISGDRNRESIFPVRSVAENIFAGNATKGKLFAPLSPKTTESFAQKAMDDYGIVAGSTAHPANSLSGGNQQKLVVGRWIALAPALLLLDDPTKGVDINSRREIHKILKGCLAQGMSVIYVSSDNEELLEISDRIYVFYEGKISAQLVGGDRTEEKLVAAMLGLNEECNQKGESE
ncbi:sugar ABC transporter ATP-binding protein [Oscillospiraceae bacterium PP1C4]